MAVHIKLIKTTSRAAAKDFNTGRHITRIICGFLPAGRRIAGGHSAPEFEEMKNLLFGE